MCSKQTILVFSPNFLFSTIKVKFLAELCEICLEIASA
jgi:hypothetical protein